MVFPTTIWSPMHINRRFKSPTLVGLFSRESWKMFYTRSNSAFWVLFLACTVLRYPKDTQVGCVRPIGSYWTRLEFSRNETIREISFVKMHQYSSRKLVDQNLHMGQASLINWEVAFVVLYTDCFILFTICVHLSLQRNAAPHILQTTAHQETQAPLRLLFQHQRLIPRSSYGRFSFQT